jgi:hypothetical protein
LQAGASFALTWWKAVKVDIAIIHEKIDKNMTKNKA